MNEQFRNAFTLPNIGFVSDTALDLPDDLDQDQWREAGLQIGRTRGATQWWVGDWWAFGEHRYGDRKAIVENEDWDGPGYDTCYQAGIVSRAFAETVRRRIVLSFNHHREVVSLPIEWQDVLLDEAEQADPRMTIARLRQRVKEVKAFLSQGWSPDQLERRLRVEDGNTVVASMQKNADDLAVDRALIDWADAGGRLVRIDRQSDWGNPFLLKDDGDRETVIENYRWYLDRKPSLKDRLPELRGKVLSCWCHPLACHGDILCEQIERGRHP